MTNEDKEKINECIRQMRLAVTTAGYTGKGVLVQVNRSPDSITYFAAVSSKGRVLHHGNQACHAGLNNPTANSPLTKGETIQFIVSRIQGKHYHDLPAEVEEHYFKWLTTHSPYRSVFVKRGGKAVRNLGFLVARTDVPSNLLAGAMFAHRMTSEAPWHVLAWHKLVKEGVHPCVAFAHSFQVKTDNTYENMLVATASGHRPWCGASFTKKMVLNFMNDVMPRANPPYVERYNYYPVHALWGDDSNDGGHLIKELNAMSQRVVKEAREQQQKVTHVNPFKAPALDNVSSPIDMFCREWAIILKKEYEDG